MKRLFIAGILAAAALTALPSTAQQPAPKRGPQTQATPDTKTFDQQMAEAQAQVKQMQDQMDRIRQTQDPQERQRLLQEHWATMQSAMTTMHGMWGPGMMGHAGMMGGQGMMGWSHMRHGYSTLTPEQQRQHQYMTDRYLGMQQEMMNQMLLQQHWMMQPPPSAPAK